MSDDVEKLMDAVFDIADENQRLRERVAELEAQTKELTFERDIAWHDGPPEEVSGLAMRATKAEAERDAARQHGIDTTNAAHAEAQRFQTLAIEREAQVAVLREALKELVDLDGCSHGPDDCPESCPMVAVENICTAVLVATGGVEVRAVLASTPEPEPDYSGLCAAPSCEGHCGYVHARGCEAVREYLADHGGKPYRAPRKEATRG